MNIRERLQDRISAVRQRAGLSARALSLMIGRGDYHVSRLEKGKLIPTIEDLERIAEACGSSLPEIFSENFESYNVDSEIIDILQSLSGRDKDVALSMLILFFKRKNDGLNDILRRIKKN